MSVNFKVKPSFFDDDDATFVFGFKKLEKTHQKDLDSFPVINSTLNLQTEQQPSPQQGMFVLYNRLLAFYKNSMTAPPQGILDLSNSRLETFSSGVEHPLYGFSVSRNNRRYVFSSTDEKTIESWVSVLRKICILSGFHEEYKAQKMIGKGSFAKVYLVDSKASGKNFAVKAFTKELLFSSSKSNAKVSLINEIDILRNIDHNNVIKIYEVYETEKSIYLIMELVQGKSLQELLKKATFKQSEARIISIISSILETLSYLSSQRIMHRDLKPDNILLEKSDRVKIVDFGLASYIDLPEYIFKKCGTPGYIAPEVFKYDQKIPATAYDHRCDLFSVGCIMFYMMFGVPFFDGSNASEILKSNRKFDAKYHSLRMIKDEMDNKNSKLSKQGLHLLLQLLEVDQNVRISAEDALSHSFLYSARPDRFGSFSEYYQTGGYSSPLSDRRGSFHKNLMASNTQRYAEKDSFYLDLGKPEINGRLDTVVNGSDNNSVLIFRTDSGTSPQSHSPFTPDSFMRGSSFKGYGGQTYRKSAMFRNQQKTAEEEKQATENSPRGGFSDMKVIRMIQFQQEENSSSEEVSQENPQIQKNIAKLLYGSQQINPSKFVSLPSDSFTGKRVFEKCF